MRKNLLLTSLLSLFAFAGFAQETAQWPITLTTADGLPGEKIVQNYVYRSNVYKLDEAVNTLRFTVVSTNTVDELTSNSHDGISAYNGTGFPFFTMSELRIYDGDGNLVPYTATTNAAQIGDGGGVEALNDQNELTYFHSTYSKGGMPHAYHYIELDLEKPVSTFSFNWNTRSRYYKNLITYMGITPGTEYLPYLDQEFTKGEQVTSLEDLKEEGALFIIKGNAPDYEVEGESARTCLGNVYFHSPYGAAETASAASAFYLIPDANNEDVYKICWLNNNHYVIAPSSVSGSTWAHWTNDELKAAFIYFNECDETEGNFQLSMNEGSWLIGADALGKMSIVENNEEKIAELSRPTSFSWTIYKANINGAAITEQLQTSIDDAQRRLDEIGLVEAEDNGEFDALTEAVAKANALVADPEVPAANIISCKRELNVLTAAYAAITIWAYVDSIDALYDAADNGEILTSSAPDWIEGSYSEDALDRMRITADEALTIIDTYQSLADIDNTISAIYEAIDQFWASEVKNVKDLPFRVGTTEDGLPGTLQSYGGYKWESPLYNITEEVQTLRFTFFKTNNMGVYSGTSYVFPTFAEMEFYGADGKKIELTSENFYANSVYMVEGGTGDKVGYPALCDGDLNTHYHAVWGANQSPEYDANPDYSFIEITFPEPISSFKYVQYGRKNGVNTPTDFVVGHAETRYEPTDVDLPDFYNTQLGEKITDLSQITDDGFYTLVGLLNCDPVDGNGEGYPKYYTGMIPYGEKIGAPAVFSIRKTENEKYLIQSLADGYYWRSTEEADGWGACTATANKELAAKIDIVPANNPDLESTFVLYEYRDSTYRSYKYPGDTIDTPDVQCPYLIFQDWGSKSASFSVPSLEANDKDGEGEWYIYKATMDNPYCYWLKSLVESAQAMDLKVSNNPGYYSVASAGAFASALAQAQTAIETNDNATAQVTLPMLEAAVAAAESAEINPMTEGFYVIESANGNFLASTGKTKAICTYYNDFETNSPNCKSQYSLWWADGPTDYENAPIYFKFQFISAANSEKVQQWLEAETITAEQAANAYYIKSCEVGQYAGTSVDGARSQDIGLTDEAEEPYIVRPQGKYKFDLWHPSHGNASIHMEGNSGGKGECGDIVYWSGGDVSSQWTLHKISDPTSIGGTKADAEGDEVVSTTYYTIGGVAVSAPVSGINIVKTVYANGVVKTTKVYIK
jgi:hypothetical protein